MIYNTYDHAVYNCLSCIHAGKFFLDFPCGMCVISRSANTYLKNRWQPNLPKLFKELYED